MKRYFFSAIIGMALAGCNSNTAGSEHQSSTADKKENTVKIAELATNKDFICDMDLTEPLGDTAMYNGKIYGFCHEDCKAEFLKDPAKYVK